MQPLPVVIRTNNDCKRDQMEGQTMRRKENFIQAEEKVAITESNVNFAVKLRAHFHHLIDRICKCRHY